ncbi:MAG: tRNA-specific 2-thiouridylase [Candidatus Aegiribacteria sp.]|nr:tRNA-specific 2-thiouridylase [Candidatus Aegiribacteria sp.]
MKVTGALVALSGGVDSSYALNLCVERYNYVRAVYVDTSGEGIPPEVENTAGAAGVELVILDAVARFRREIILWSAKMLSQGLTPNPCARCNAKIKLLTLHEILKSSETLVTGHYARKNGTLIQRGADAKKDQSYFLSLVDSDILKDCTFPLGHMLKEDVRREASRLNIPFRKKESMDLCFSPTAFEGKPGRVMDISGREVGRHDGTGNYTVGQRKGLGAYGRRMYVVAVNSSGGTITIGGKKDLLSTGCTVVDMNWFREPSSFPAEALVQIRYRRKAVPAILEYRDGILHIEFTRPEEAVAPGQVCAVYLDTSVTGGGMISSTDQPDWKSNEE